MSHVGYAVLLWDIDGTLLSTGRGGVFALEAAAAEVCGTMIDLHGMETAGQTDAEIAARVVARCGGSPDGETVPAFLAAYGRELPDCLFRRTGAVIEGVREVLEDLRGDDRVLNLLLTGNTRVGAAAKLAHYRLAAHFPDGAFCEGPGPRSEIARRAVALAAARLGLEPDPERTFVIGDTPHDVACGKAVGVRTIAVATGPYGVAELRAAGAWHAAERLPPPPAFRRLVGLPVREAPTVGVAP